MRQYYIQLLNQEKGPYSLEQLRHIYFQKSTPIWFEGLSNWTIIQEVPEVNALLSTAPHGTVPPPPVNATTPLPTKQRQ
jgi:hypothetical protein